MFFETIIPKMSSGKSAGILLCLPLAFQIIYMAPRIELTFHLTSIKCTLLNGDFNNTDLVLFSVHFGKRISVKQTFCTFKYSSFVLMTKFDFNHLVVVSEHQHQIYSSSCHKYSCLGNVPDISHFE